MREIVILYTPPIVLTKDKNWKPKQDNKIAGAIIYLPDDAVLVVPPKIREKKS